MDESNKDLYSIKQRNYSDIIQNQNEKERNLLRMHKYTWNKLEGTRNKTQRGMGELYLIRVDKNRDNKLTILSKMIDTKAIIHPLQSS